MHLPWTLRVFVTTVTFGAINDNRASEPTTGTILRAARKTKILGASFEDPTTGERVAFASPAIVVPLEEQGEIRGVEGGGHGD